MWTDHPTGHLQQDALQDGVLNSGAGADYPTIAATLSAIHANRCSPPLEHTEIDGILKSACRYASGTAAPHVNGEVHAELDTFAVATYGAESRGKAGNTDREVGQQDTVYELAGHDWIDGYIGDDELYGGRGQDHVYGDDADYIVGGQG